MVISGHFLTDGLSIKRLYNKRIRKERIRKNGFKIRGLICVSQIDKTASRTEKLI